MPFSSYIALGDSMSIDRYPALDLSEGRFAEMLRTVDDAPVGAASLLYVNDDDLWPDFEGRDLASLHPGIRKQDLAEDAATTGDVFIAQLPRVAASPDESIVTLTIGGNDLLSAYAGRHGRGVLERVVRDVGDAIDHIVRRLVELLPNAIVAATPNARLADVHAHFLGHGVTAPENERWYWRHSIIEPSVEGASEIRRVWLECIAAQRQRRD
jgi:lysophospholipase L1-like esterase